MRIFMDKKVLIKLSIFINKRVTLVGKQMCTCNVLLSTAGLAYPHGPLIDVSKDN